MTERRIELEGGKYVLVDSGRGQLKALRYGEEWRDLTGDKMIGCLAFELHRAREALRTIATNSSSVQLDPQWAVRVARSGLE